MSQPRVAFVVPSDTKCGVYTYSSFLRDGFPSRGKFAIEWTPNTCGSELSKYSEFARSLEEKFELIHVQFEFGRFGKLGVSGVGAIPFYQTFHDTHKIITTIHELPRPTNFFVETIQNFILGHVLTHSGKVIVHTHDAQHKLAERFPKEAHKLVVLAHGMTIFPAASKKPKMKMPAMLQKKKVIGFFGFLTPGKNVGMVIEALAKLPESYAAVIAGGTQSSVQDTYVETLKRRAEELHVSHRIHWTGFVPSNEIPTVFSWMDVVIFPYNEITESGAMHIALGNRKLILATPLPAFEEIEKNYHCIRTFSGVDGLVSSITALESNARERKQLLANIAQFTADRNWKNTAKKHIALYEKILTDPASRHNP